MIRKPAAALAAIFALSACGLGGPRLDPLTDEDKARFSGYTCRAVRDDGAFLFITNGEVGLIRYRGRPVEMRRLVRDMPFDPADTESLTMISSDVNLELRFQRVVQPPGEGSDAPESFSRSMMVTIEDRSMGGARRLNQGAELRCGS